jgi:TolB-like protein
VAGQHSSLETVRFGPFELDRAVGELRRGGVRVRLHGQPLQVLQVLLEQPGKLISREELQSRIWPSETFVDFDHGINNAIKRLREVLGDTAETPRYVETVPRRGYRFIGQVSAVTEHGAETIRSVAVLPLENLSGNPDEEYFADGLTEASIINLAKISALRVISRTTVMQYKRAYKPLPQVARELQVDGIVEGTVLRSGNRVRISAQLIDARTNCHIWAEIYERDLKDILALHSDLARAIAGQVRIALTPAEQLKLGRGRPVDPEAYEDYLKGRYHWNRRSADDLKKAMECFQRAIDKQPNYAPAHTGLADCAGIAGFWSFAAPEQGCGKSKTAALRSLAIEETAEAHASLAWAIMHYDWDLTAAEQEFQRAIEQDPLYATAHQWYGHCLVGMGRFDEAYGELRLAIQLEPLSLPIRTSYAGASLFGRQWEQSIEQSKKILDLDPSFILGRWALVRYYDAIGMAELAIASAQEAVEVSRGTLLCLIAELGHAYASAGKREDAVGVLRRLAEICEQRYVDPYLIAYIYAALGERESAFEYLDHAIDVRAVWVCYLAIDPRFDALRDDSRFEALLQRAGLPWRLHVSEK